MTDTVIYPFKARVLLDTRYVINNSHINSHNKDDKRLLV